MGHRSHSLMPSSVLDGRLDCPKTRKNVTTYPKRIYSNKASQLIYRNVPIYNKPVMLVFVYRKTLTFPKGNLSIVF